MRELDKVPLGAATRKKADKLWQRISDGRRFALTEKLPQHAGDLPDRLAGTEAPAPPRVRRASAQKNRAASNPPNPPATRSPKASRPAVAATPADPEALARLDITLYSTPWCGYCSKARSWLQSKGYPFVEKNIEKDPAAHKEYLVAGKGYRGVPLILVNGKSFRGFNKRSVKRAIDKVLAGS
ncbi:MAG TPA: hypothetical protein DIU15_11815 [Deltaproteobacteria bacterium]|nr:hypothetical protein [Deltaproteobacteria bacterium]HCP46725.1 hypothetical protein [Deltaproteobacteria bacterium]